MEFPPRRFRPAGQVTRRRHFHGVGRYPGTLQQVAAELNAEGTDYLLLPDGPPETAGAAALANGGAAAEP